MQPNMRYVGGEEYTLFLQFKTEYLHVRIYVRTYCDQDELRLIRVPVWRPRPVFAAVAEGEGAMGGVALGGALNLLETRNYNMKC